MEKLLDLNKVITHCETCARYDSKHCEKCFEFDQYTIDREKCENCLSWGKFHSMTISFCDLDGEKRPAKYHCSEWVPVKHINKYNPREGALCSFAD